MNGKTAKAIRKEFKSQLEHGTTETWVSHAKPYINQYGQPVLKYSFTYGIRGFKKMVRLAKKAYKKNHGRYTPKQIVAAMLHIIRNQPYANS